MRVAAIDIGTNSMRLLIADYEDGRFKEREKHINTTRIGESVDEEGIINDDAIERNVDALEDFTELAREKGCKQIWAVGTSALRDSKNSGEFLQRALEKSGVAVEIISGSTEADLGFMGVLEGIQDKDENILVVDIGGGSTEFIVGNKYGIKFMKSENVGALRMTEKFLKKDPVDKIEYMSMENHVSNEIDDTVGEICRYNIKKVVGIGGTITSVAAMLAEMEVYDMDKIHSSIITYPQICELLKTLKRLKTSEKMMLNGLQPKRADIITAGVGILEIVLRKICFDRMIVSEYDNLEGLVSRKISI
ncbi:exopolyphosphatase / guanosine-5'-triphosphate,3'-diphosphate pyrophosphatase [Peptoclostridium litorale DSM 5388]|uniref:Bifunctional 3-dehydroquinate synthase/phosphatase AroB n=1 Tax=Peptoclostridium litorale DSM 5388 TaxID=1121324 RepID=A0A069RCE9_PEPLI|nr:Ppx/GppA phosphatase family protein [Peptoclostridium litorale]KDR94686.1 bifunctional 3-dehydroquinate synthase/phosphatase AroB [Peptoclostridium litorale DSM 5388]SIO32612.1 exopolyphosphatase / guanosine-5'-triphosphate,3'-diphosphate pyrophosphatase [Peptoclostridium litorale DSM 5388]